MLELLEIIEDVRRIPGTLKSEATRIAVALGVDAYPELHCLIRKNSEQKWEIVAVALDASILPAATDGAIRCVARLDRAKNPEKT